MNVFKSVSSSVYLEVNLDDLQSNVNVLRSHCPNSNTGLIAVVKAGAYGHGSVKVSNHLKKNGTERLAVATIAEGIHLRKNNTTGPIHIFGNLPSWQTEVCVDNGLIPSVSHEDTVIAMAESISKKKTSKNPVHEVKPGAINIKVDSNMSRNGCQVEDLQKIVRLCEDLAVPIDGIYTQLANSWGSLDFTQKQITKFMEAVEPVRSKNVHLHVANSGAILNDIGTDLDFIRPGITLYGLPPDTACSKFQSFGLKPIAKLRGIPTLVKTLEPQRSIGYSMTYTTQKSEHIATFPIGYADGFWRHLSSDGQKPIGSIIRDKTGEKCPIVGRVSMDAITVSLPSVLGTDETFTLVTNDYDPDTSASGISVKVQSIAYEVATRWSTRIPRVYVTQDSELDVVPGLDQYSY